MNDLHSEIRLARLPDDYPAMAAIIAATDPDFRPTPEVLEREDSTLDPALHFTRFVAQDASDGPPLVIGMASVGLDRWNPREGVWNLNIRVLPESQRRGIGEALYQTILAHLSFLHPRELKAQVREDHASAVAFLEHRGFREVWRRFESRLDTAQFDFAPYEGLEERINTKGIRIITYPELESDLERDRKLFELDMELFEDIPLGEELTKPSFERWKLDHLDAERVLRDAFFVAIEGERYVGMSNLWEDNQRFLTAMTGVRRTHRGLGLALALKLRGIRYATDHGSKEITTMNDAPNAAMIGINEKLGFRRSPAWVRYARKLEERA